MGTNTPGHSQYSSYGKAAENYLSGMNSKPANITAEAFKNQQAFEAKIALLEKQLAWEKLRADALDIMINIAEKQLDIDIRKKSGSQQSQK